MLVRVVYTGLAQSTRGAARACLQACCGSIALIYGARCSNDLSTGQRDTSFLWSADRARCGDGGEQAERHCCSLAGLSGSAAYCITVVAHLGGILLRVEEGRRRWRTAEEALRPGTGVLVELLGGIEKSLKRARIIRLSIMSQNRIYF